MSDHPVTGITILGSTGTIGINTLDVIRRHPGRYRVSALTADTSVARLYEQCIEFRPEVAVLRDPDRASELARRLSAAGQSVEVLSALEGLQTAAALAGAGTVMAAIVGSEGLMPSLAAVRAGKRVLLANKEALVMTGELFMEEARRHGAQILPIDSEHNAIFQCLPDQPGDLQGVERILLTASGGPFRTWSREAMHAVTPEQACAHPNWKMGRKISVDSATMMNKGLEVIEACWLYNTEPERIQVVLHPQSVIHSMVSYADGSVLAQLGNPDMRTPIAHALAWPERIESGVRPLDVFEVAHLDFERPDPARFPCLQLAYDCFDMRGTAFTILNAANEIAVEGFLNHAIGFTEIPRVIEQTLESLASTPADSLEIIQDANARARRTAAGFVKSRSVTA